MNKVSRKSGGLPLSKIPPEFAKYLGYINQIALFVEDDNIINPTYFRLPQNPSLFTPQFIFDTFSDPMKHLETVLRIISVDFALDVLKSSYYFASKSDHDLTQLLSNHDFPIFKPEMGDEGANIYLDCLRRYVGFSSLYLHLDDLVFNWRHKKDEAKFFFEDADNADQAFHIKSRFVNWNEFFKLSVKQEKKKFYIEVKNNEWVEILQKLEIERVRRCIHCRKFYWAERTDTRGCRDCLSNKNKPVNDFSESRQKGRNKIEAEQKRNAEIKQAVDSQPPFVYETPEDVIGPIESKWRLGQMVLKDGDLYTVTEVRNNLLCLTPVPRIGVLKKVWKMAKHTVWGN